MSKIVKQASFGVCGMFQHVNNMLNKGYLDLSPMKHTRELLCDLQLLLLTSISAGICPKLYCM